MRNLPPVLDVQLGQHAVDVVLDGSELDSELGRDLLVGVATLQKGSNLPLPAAQDI